MYEFKRKRSSLYLRYGATIECPFRFVAGVNLDTISTQTDQEIRDAVKLALCTPELHDKHITVERSDTEIAVYTTGSNVIESVYRGCIIYWQNTRGHNGPA